MYYPIKGKASCSMKLREPLLGLKLTHDKNPLFTSQTTPPIAIDEPLVNVQPDLLPFFLHLFCNNTGSDC